MPTGDRRFNGDPVSIPHGLIELLKSCGNFGWLENRVEVITTFAGTGIKSIEYNPVPVAAKVMLLHRLNQAVYEIGKQSH